MLACLTCHFGHSAATPFSHLPAPNSLQAYQVLLREVRQAYQVLLKEVRHASQILLKEE